MAIHDMDTARKRLRDLIHSRNLLQRQIAHECGVGEPAVAGWLGNRPIPLKQLEHLAKFFGVDPKYMRGEDVAIANLCSLRVEIARTEGLFRGLLLRRPYIASVFREELPQMYWRSLINESRQLLNAVDQEWDKFIKGLLYNLQEQPEFREEYVRLVIQICHYLSNRMKFEHRIRLAEHAVRCAAEIAEYTSDSEQKRNWLAANLLLEVDAVCWASIELGEVDEIVDRLKRAADVADRAKMPHMVVLAKIFHARAMLHAGIVNAKTLGEREAIFKRNALQARAILETLNEPDWTDYILSNRYYAVSAEVALAEGQFDDAIAMYDIMVDHGDPVEFGVGTQSSLIYAYVAKATASDTHRRASAIKRANELLQADSADKLWSEDLLTCIAKIRLYELEGKRAEALELAIKTRTLFVVKRRIRKHNLIGLLEMLITELSEQQS